MKKEYAARLLYRRYIRTGHEVLSPRIDVATEAHPNRWTHHVLISDVSEIDDELMGWVKEASAFSEAKR